MANKKKVARNEFIQGTKGIVGGAVILGVGSSVVGGIGGSTAAAAQSGLLAGASFLPVIGSAFGAGIVVNRLRGLQDQVENKRRKR